MPHGDALTAHKNDAATAIDAAVQTAINNGLRTADLFTGRNGETKVSTQEMAQAIATVL